MKGFISKALAGLALGSGLYTLAGCYTYRQCVDPCWPERYNAVARHTVIDTFNAQAWNGHILDQTIWNYHFDPGTDNLTVAGIEHLKYLARRRPCPDPKLYLATAQDLPWGMPAEKMALAHSELDQKRIGAIQKFMALYTANRGTPCEFEVAIHDPAELGIPALPIAGNQPVALQGALPRVYDKAGQIVVPVTVGGSTTTSAK